MWKHRIVAIDFADSPVATLGVEWEFALVDKHSRDLVNAASELFDLMRARHGSEPRLHKELLRNTVELTTGICTSVDGAMGELAEMIAKVRPLARTRTSTSPRQGLRRSSSVILRLSSKPY
jgi:carboxylate-amine ligase